MATRLPVVLTSFIGREREIAHVSALLRRDDVRLLTLTGPGGVGKTRLARQVAETLAWQWPDGVVFAPLATVREPEFVATAIARALGLREAGKQPLAQRLIRSLRDREVLLLLDNFEHVLEAGPQIADILAGCPRVTALVTSRELLRVSGEHDFPVPPLALPEDAASAEQIVASEAVSLFVARASAVAFHGALTAESCAEVAAICRRLDGLPLAIELAAARTAHLPMGALLSRLERRLPLLTGGPRDQPTRLRAMRDAIAWSHDLLVPDEQRLFRRLAVFVGGFTLKAATAVTAREGAPDHAILDGVAALVTKSLLRPSEDPGGEPRYQMLETIREFGLEQLAIGGEAADAGRAHGTYFLALAEQGANALSGPHQIEWLTRLETERPNLRAALAWFRSQGETEMVLRLAASLWYFWFIRGHNREGSAWLAEALTAPQAWSAALREALHGASMFASNQGDHRQAAAHADALLRMAQAEDDGEGLARAVFLRSFAATYQGDRALALTLAEEALARCRRLGDPHWTGVALNRLAIECHIQGDYARAEGLYNESLDVWRERGDTWGLCFVTTNLGVNAQAQGQTTRAATRYRESLLLLQSLGESWGDDELLPLVAALAATSGLDEGGARLIGATDRLLDTIGYSLPPFVHVFYQQATARLHRTLGEERFSAAREAGQRLTPAEALAEALAVVTVLADAPAAAPPAAVSGGLTARELEVARLVAQGRSNREIADALFISVPTVKRHLSNVLGKLDLPSRSALTAYAHTRGLV